MCPGHVNWTETRDRLRFNPCSKPRYDDLETLQQLPGDRPTPGALTTARRISSARARLKIRFFGRHRPAQWTALGPLQESQFASLGIPMELDRGALAPMLITAWSSTPRRTEEAMWMYRRWASVRPASLLVRCHRAATSATQGALGAIASVPTERRMKDLDPTELD